MKVIETILDEDKLDRKINRISSMYRRTVILAMSKLTIDEFKRHYPSYNPFGLHETNCTYQGYTILQNDKLPFGEVEIMIELP